MPSTMEIWRYPRKTYLPQPSLLTIAYPRTEEPFSYPAPSCTLTNIPQRPCGPSAFPHFGAPRMICGERVVDDEGRHGGFLPPGTRTEDLRIASHAVTRPPPPLAVAKRSGRWARRFPNAPCYRGALSPVWVAHNPCIHAVHRNLM